MKKIIMVILALAVGISYIPVAKAGETASFGLTVSFAQPLSMRTIPEGPFEIDAGDIVNFRVEAKDLDANMVEVNVVNLPVNAFWQPDPMIVGVPVTSHGGTFHWVPQGGQSAHRIQFTAVSYGKDSIDVEHAELTVEITVNYIEPVLSIIVDPETLTLENKVRLGAIVDIIDAAGGPPIVKNVGNTPVAVEMSYGATIQVEGQIRPGLEQGLDTFITLVEVDPTVRLLPAVLNPAGVLPISLNIGPEEQVPLIMHYGAPTDLSDNAAGSSVIYELRASPAVKILPIPDDIVSR